MSRQGAVIEAASLEEGIRRMVVAANRERSQPLIVVPHLSVEEEALGLRDALLVQIATVVLVESPATLPSSGWMGGPVLAAGLDPEAAVRLFAHDSRATAIFSVAPRVDGTLPTDRR